MPWRPVPRSHTIAALIGLGLLALWMAVDDDAYLRPLDDANLAFHEVGHQIYGLFGSTLALYGGTLGQLTFPAVAAATFFWRRDPYFLELFRRLDQRIEYPHELALAMTSGRVVASLVLRADGSFGEIALHAGSGYEAFDREVTDALKAVGKLPAVPSALLGGRAALRVRIPYTFKNPMIQ